MEFCIRDDDTSFFTDPEELEHAYGAIKAKGPVSLAIVPFCRAGTSQAVPERFRGRWTIHPLHDNSALVAYLREEIGAGRFEAMLHGYHHDERNGSREFSAGRELRKRALEGRKYLEDVLETRISVFVPPHNEIRRAGLRAVELAGLHLSGVTGVRTGWPVLSLRTWRTWLHLKRWESQGGIGVPWVIDLGRHLEIPAHPVTPSSLHSRNEAAFDQAVSMRGVFCAATHYWELETPSRYSGEPSAGEQLRRLVDRALGQPSEIRWRSVGAVAQEAAARRLGLPV